MLEHNKEVDKQPHYEDVGRKTEKIRTAENDICEITGHARESSLDDYDQIDENEKRDLSHII